MLIETYFNQILDIIKTCLFKENFTFYPEKRGTYEGFWRGQVTFSDQSCLYLREFVYVEITIDRKMYSYQYMNFDNNLIFRYDNTEHHRKLNLPNFPHHKHDKSEENVIDSNAPFLRDIFQEINRIQIFRDIGST